MAKIVLHQFNADPGVESGSPFCVKVHRMLVFKGLSYEPHDVGSPRELGRLNPGVRKVPVLEHDGELIADSSRIAAFLDERYPDRPLLPSGPRARAKCRLFEDWADESLYWFAVYQRWAVDGNFRPFAQRAFGSLPVPVRWIVPRVVRRQVRRDLRGQGLGRLPHEQLLGIFERHLVMLEALLDGRPYLDGDELTLADIAVFAPLRAASVATVPETAELTRRHPPIVEWLEGIDRATSGEHTVAFS